MRRLSIFMLSLLVFLPAAAGRGYAVGKERVYKGKTAREWLAELKGNSRRKVDVIDKLGEMGPDARVAVPALIDALKDEVLRVAAVDALGDIGPDAKAAVPALMEALRADKTLSRSHIALALGLMGEAAVPALVQAIEKQEDIQELAADALGDIGEPAVGPLVQLLKAKNEHTRSLAPSLPTP